MPMRKLPSDLNSSPKNAMNAGKGILDPLEKLMEDVKEVMEAVLKEGRSHGKEL
jgi:hypothetical protein